jgi:adenylate cyclase class 2
MTFEVELKFPIDDPAELTLKLIALGAVPGAVLRQRDVYFRHPARDFRQTHEAFRLRRSGDELYLTYKGPVVDSQTKTRREIEVPVGRGAHDLPGVAELLVRLGFEPLPAVEKTRALYHLALEDHDFELAVDAVDALGSFLEIETLADESRREASRDAVLRLAQRLGLSNPERRSYLHLLLEKLGEEPSA